MVYFEEVLLMCIGLPPAVMKSSNKENTSEKANSLLKSLQVWMTDTRFLSCNKNLWFGEWGRNRMEETGLELLRGSIRFYSILIEFLRILFHCSPFSESSFPSFTSVSTSRLLVLLYHQLGPRCFTCLPLTLYCREF